MITLPDIVAGVADAYGLALDDLIGPSRVPPRPRARQLAMWLARRNTAASYPEIGRAVRRRTVSTVVDGIRGIERRLAEWEDPGVGELRLLADLALALADGHTGEAERAALERHRAVARDEAEITAGLEREEIRLARAAALQLRAAGKGVL
jgi:hypothetical protein